jgi:hypothetical protein
MPVAIAKQSIGLGLQSVAGTPVAPTTWAPFRNISIKGKYAGIENDAHRYNEFGRRADQFEIYPDGVEGGVEGFVYSKGFIDMLLRAAMGPAATSTANSPVVGYTKRTFTKGDLASLLTVQKIIPKDGAEDTFTYTDCVVNSLSIRGAAKQFLGVSAEFLGKSERDDFATTAPVYTDLGKPFLVGPSRIAMTVTDATDGGAVFTTCYESYDFTITNGFNEIDVWCGKTITPDTAPTFKLSLSNGDYSKTWWQKMTANKDLAVTITHTLAADVNTTFKLTFPSVKAMASAPDQSSTALNPRQSVELTPMIPAGGGSPVTIEISATT